MHFLLTCKDIYSVGNPANPHSFTHLATQQTFGALAPYSLLDFIYWLEVSFVNITLDGTMYPG